MLAACAAARERDICYFRNERREIQMTPTKVFAPKPQSFEPGTWNLEPGTWNREAGLSLVTAIFLMVVLAMLGAFMLSVTAIQQSSQQFDVQGVRAYQAARAGIEWGAFQMLDPNNTQNPATCSPLNWPGTCVASTNLTSLAGSLSPFTVTVTCA